MNIILFEGERFFPRGDERCSHILKVLHKKAGDSFSAGIVNGATGTAVITEAGGDGIRFSFTPERPPEPLFPVWLVIGFPRPIQLKRLLRAVSSMGAAGVILAGTDLGEKSYRDSGVFERGTVRAALLDGAMQSGFSAVSEVLSCESVDAALACTAERFPAARRVLLDTENVAPFVSEKIAGINASAPLCLAVGSERGWSARERALFAESGWQARRLGGRIMRTETAATAGLAVALALCGFWGETAS